MPNSPRDTSLAQLGAAAEAFALESAGGAGAVEKARRAGVRVLSGRDEVVQGPPDSHGNEHDIWFREMDGEARVIKITRGGTRSTASRAARPPICGVGSTRTVFLAMTFGSSACFLMAAL